MTPEVLEITLLFIVHGYFVYSKSKWPRFLKVPEFEEILIAIARVKKQEINKYSAKKM
jgi:hypothetical protein